MEKLYFTLKGLSELLMHNPAGMSRPTDEMKRKKIPEAEKEALASRYVLPDGNFYVPAIAVRNCLLNGARGYRIGRKAAPSILGGAILLVDEVFPIVRNGKPLKGTEYSVDIRRAVIKRAGIMRARARIELPWEVEGWFGYNSSLASVDDVKLALDVGGQTVGLLDYRVEKKGWFGRFEVADIRSEEE